MLSKKNGVSGKLSREHPGLINIHCIAHRLNLGVSSGWKSDIHLRTLNKMIYSLCKLFKQAPFETSDFERIPNGEYGLY